MGHVRKWARRRSDGTGRRSRRFRLLLTRREQHRGRYAKELLPYEKSAENRPTDRCRHDPILGALQMLRLEAVLARSSSAKVSVA